MRGVFGKTSSRVHYRGGLGRNQRARRDGNRDFHLHHGAYPAGRSASQLRTASAGRRNASSPRHFTQAALISAASRTGFLQAGADNPVRIGCSFECEVHLAPCHQVRAAG